MDSPISSKKPSNNKHLKGKNKEIVYENLWRQIYMRLQKFWIKPTLNIQPN